jgi:hypothetical protein
MFMSMPAVWFHFVFHLQHGNCVLSSSFADPTRHGAFDNVLTSFGEMETELGNDQRESEPLRAIVFACACTASAWHASA